ncbi:MAG: hypothetical protein EXQ85_07695 [Alphaproteobacteria bacterium]|nr:hypothetical protein [Alphaproteobacteria bacterium]
MDQASAKAVARVDAAPTPAVPADHKDLVAEALRVRAEVREKLGEETVRKLYKIATGKDLTE